MGLKKLLERRNKLIKEINEMFAKCETETRSFSEEEEAAYEKAMAEIKKIDATLKAHEEARALKMSPKEKEEAAVEAAKFEVEARAFADYIRAGRLSAVENRSAVNMTMGDNGAVIPSTIANKIIENVEEICPIYELSTHYNVKGELTFPVYDETGNKVACAYASEFTALSSQVGKFGKITLKGYLAAALVKISRSLINNAEFDIVAYVVSKLSLAISRFLEHELLLGDGSNHIEGVTVGAKQIVTAKASSAITADELIDLQMAVPEVYQREAVFIMNSKTLAAIRKLKDNDGRYLLQNDLTAGFGYTLLQKHVYLSDNMPVMGSSAKAIVYGDLSGISVKMAPDVEMQILMEKYADEHAVGAVAWFEADAKVTEQQKVAVLKMGA